MGDDLFHADGRTDGNDEAISRFSQCYETPKNCISSYSLIKGISGETKETLRIQGLLNLRNFNTPPKWLLGCNL